MPAPATWSSRNGWPSGPAAAGLHSAIGAGIPAGRIFGASGDSVGAIIASIFTGGSGSGHPILQNGATVCLAASAGAALVLLFIAFLRPAGYGLSSAVGLLILGQLAFAGGEWVREDLRKPYVIGRYMFVNSVRLPTARGAPGPPAGMEQYAADRFALPALNETGVLNASLWNRAPVGFDPLSGPDPSLTPEERAAVEATAGELLFRQLCWSCHTVDGYLAVRPLVKDKSAAGLENVLGDPHLRLKTRRGFRMPPFTGTAAEKRALAVWLARLGGDPLAGVEAEQTTAGPDGPMLFEEHCAICHEPDSDLEIESLIDGYSEDELYGVIGMLEELSDEMFPFEGTDEERRALAGHLAALTGKEVE